jgi:hypothetical protein
MHRSREADGHIAAVRNVLYDADLIEPYFDATRQICWRAKEVLPVGCMDVDLTFYFPVPLQGDLSNRVKIVEDALASALGINDSIFHGHLLDRRYDKNRPRVNVKLSWPHSDRSESDDLYPRCSLNTPLEVRATVPDITCSRRRKPASRERTIESAQERG